MRKTVPMPPPESELEEARRLSREITKDTISAGITHEQLLKKARKIRHEIRSKEDSSSY